MSHRAPCSILLVVALLALVAGCGSNDAPDEVPTEGSAEALTELIGAVRGAFENSTVVEPLIYPKGWVKRRLHPAGFGETVKHSPSGANGPVEARLGVTILRLNSMIHPDEASAQADDQLLPYPPGPSREEMTGDQFVEAHPYVELTVDYQWDGSRWVRQSWNTDPKLTVGSDWLDRLGVP